MKYRSITVATLALLLGTTLLAASDQQNLKVGKNGDVLLTEPTVAGADTLPPGRYRVEHRARNGEHFIDFYPLNNSNGKAGQKYSAALKCDFKPHPASLILTGLVLSKVNGTQYVTRFEVASGDHSTGFGGFGGGAFVNASRSSQGREHPVY